MRQTVDRSNAVRHAVAALFLGMAYFGVQLTVHADQSAASAPIVSKTTLAEARDIWATGNASTVSEGHLAIGGGNGRDGFSKVGLEQVLLVTVAGVDFETLPVARYAFVDEVLYAISAQFRERLSKDKSAFKELTDEEISQLEESLTRKYGKPRGLRDLGAGKKPNIFIWDLRENEMILAKSVMSGYQLTLRNKALAKKVDAYKKIECKMHRQKGDTPTPVTEICL
jgi:hypothetical protein